MNRRTRNGNARRSTQGFCRWPAAAESRDDCAPIDAQCSCPLGESKDLAPKRDRVISSRVVRLFVWRRPARIAGFIVAIIVSTLNRVLRTRPRSYVAQECRKVLPPCVTHADASAAVISVLLVSLAIAPSFDAAPDRVLGRVRGAVRGPTFDRQLPVETPARTRASCDERTEKDQAFTTAIAFAKRICLLATVARQLSEECPTPVSHERHFISTGYVFNAQTGQLEPKPADAKSPHD